METSTLPGPLRVLLDEAPGATPRDWSVDAALTGVLALLCVSPYVLALAAFGLGGHLLGYRYGHPLLVALTAMMFVAPVLLRRHYPLLMSVLVAVAGLAQVLVSGFPMLTVLVVPVVTYSVARWVEGAPARLVVWLGLAGSFLGPARWLFVMNPFSFSMVVPYLMAIMVCVFAVITPYAIGRRVREAALFTDVQRRRELERRHAMLTQAEQRARMAEIHARQQIAQELHDIVAHSLSVMIVQAEGGRALAGKKPEAAAQVLDTIADTGREALGEMRRIVSVLRTETVGADYGPAPTLTDVPEMVRRAGDRVELTVIGEPAPVPPTVGLTLYRVVQEALTNVLKHAGHDAHAWVTITYAPHGVQVQVRDDGVGAGAFTDGQGNGLRGMHERLASVHGRLEAHPLPGGGFLVRADVPLRRSPA